MKYTLPRLRREYKHNLGHMRVLSMKLLVSEKLKIAKLAGWRSNIHEQKLTLKPSFFFPGKLSSKANTQSIPDLYNIGGQCLVYHDLHPLFIFGQRKGRSWYCISHATSSSFLIISSCCRYQAFGIVFLPSLLWFFTSFLTFFFFAVYLVAHT